MRQHWALSPWVRGVILLLLAVGALAFVLARSPTDQPAPPSVEEVLGRWREVVGSPGDDGIRTFVARSLSTSYFVGDERAGMPSNTFEYTVWFQAPARQRTQWTSVFLTRSPGGEEPPVTSETLVWDGTDHWSHWRDDEGWEGVTVRRQQPGESILYGPVVHTEVITSRCRVATVTGEEAIDGRDAWILELSRPHCGAPFPGHDGRAVAWIDKATGFVLRARQYSASGRLGGTTDITLVEINGVIEPALFRFEVADGVTIHDRRDASTAWGPPDWVARPMPVSLSQASREATFDIILPTALPAGFERESIEHYWKSETARASRSHADWVRLRYASPTGDWLIIEQGFGGYLTDFAGADLVGIPRGTARVGAADAQWVDGLPITGWEPGVLMMLSIESNQVSGGWAIGLDSGRLFERPFSVLLASNRLTLHQLIEVAESLR